MEQELERLYNILTEFLGDAKNGFDDKNLQYQFPCPHCIEKYGIQEARKFNLEVNISKGVYSCWKCSSEGDDTMHGSVKKLIRLFGNNELLNEYMSIIRSIRDSELYKLHFQDFDTSIATKEDLKLPTSFKFFKEGETYNRTAFKYLQDRGIGWDIINKYKIGYTERENENKRSSYRVIIPSYDVYGELNYWVGRDYLPNNDKFKRVKYDNPKIDKTSIIFDELHLQWDADITLVEGPFDHIVVPNSIPLLGKALKRKHKLYWDLITKSKACVNLWLDDDAKDTSKQIYSLLNHGNLYGKIRIIETDNGKDPSEIYEKYGHKGIAECLSKSKKLDEWTT